MAQAEIGIIGGSGLYSMPGFSDVNEVKLQTPFGDPSESYVIGVLEGRRVAFSHDTVAGIASCRPS